MVENSKEWLEENGFDGLYLPGECACLIDDYAPCGEDCQEDCHPGYKHQDPREGYEGYWAVSGSKKPLTEEEWTSIAYS